MKQFHYRKNFPKKIEIFCTKQGKYAIIKSLTNCHISRFCRNYQKKSGEFVLFDESSFLLLRNVLWDAYSLQICYFADWTQDISDMDKGMRGVLRGPAEQYNVVRSLLPPLRCGEIVSLKDTLLVRYLLIRGMEKRDFYSIGPFRSQPLSQKDIAWLQTRNRLSAAEVEELRNMLSGVPTNLNRMITMAVARNLLKSFYDLPDPGTREVDLSAEPEGLPPVVPLEDINIRAKRVEEVYLHEERLRACIAEGNYQKALQEARFFSQSGLSRNLPNLALPERSFFYAANTMFRVAAQSVNIHPLYLDEISQKFARKIALCTSSAQLTDVYMEMISGYCKLCRDQSMTRYSGNARKIVNYILLNLGTDLSANVIGLATGFSEGFVSRLIKEETGMTLNQFVTGQRIRVAKRRLEDSSDSISSIAGYVGIPDWNYFTKLFKKVEGCTPSQYRKRVRGT